MVGEFGEAEQLATATRIAERMYARKPAPGRQAILDAVGSKLVRRGFSVAIARAACLNVLAGAPEPADG